jgi:hypothetical protein
MEGGGGGEVACAIYRVLVVLCGWAGMMVVCCGVWVGAARAAGMEKLTVYNFNN